MSLPRWNVVSASVVSESVSASPASSVVTAVPLKSLVSPAVNVLLIGVPSIAVPLFKTDNVSVAKFEELPAV